MIPLITITLLVLLQTIMNRIGIYKIDLFLFQQKQLIKQQELKKQMLKLKQELRLVSAQDEFSKWAKLKRKLEQLLKEYKGIKVIKSNRLQIVLYLLLGSSLVYWVFTPVFYIPNWFQLGLHWPGSPVGSCSVIYWYFAITSVFNRLARLI